MSEISKPKEYRDMIDALVEMCHNGQGQIASRHVLEGVWNKNATPDMIAAQDEDEVLPLGVQNEYRKMLAEDLEVNLLLARMPIEDRKIIARLLAKEVECGVFETLKVLEEYEITPFETGYEGSPFNDFVGRLNEWEWPKS